MNRVDAVVRGRVLALSGRGREIRLALGLSLADVAQEVRCDKSSVSRWETSRHAPRGEAAVRYARLLDRLERQVPDAS
jgi:transcriptional regulator with XRE-family HTH domain